MPIITENNYTFTSADGATPIHVREWVPDCDINGVVQIAHGINKYIGRYEHFARYLASKGFVVVGNDHLGHGESVLGPEYLGFFALDEGWYKVVADMEQLRELTAAIVCSATVAGISPLSTGGSLVMAGYAQETGCDEKEQQKVFGQLFMVSAGCVLIVFILTFVGLLSLVG